MLTRMTHAVTLIPGDGTGPELTEAARRVLEATGVEFAWDVREAGVDVMDVAGTPLPEETLDSIRKSGVALKGPITTPIGTGLPVRERGAAARARAVRLYPPLQVVPGRALTLRQRRSRGRPREHRGPVRGHRVRSRNGGCRARDRDAERHAGEADHAHIGHLGEADQPGGVGADHPLRVRAMRVHMAVGACRASPRRTS